MNAPELQKMSLSWPLVMLILGLFALVTIYLIFHEGAVRVKHIEIKTINSIVESFHTKPKLVVLTAHLNMTLHRETDDAIKVPLIDFEISPGKTVVDMAFLDNRVQYYVMLDKIDSGKFKYDPETRILHVHIPQPMLDAELIEVQQDKSKIFCNTKNGWAKFDAYSGAVLRDELKQSVRDEIRAQAEKDKVLNETAINSARLIIQDFVQTTVTATTPGTTVVAEVSS